MEKAGIVPIIGPGEKLHETLIRKGRIPPYLLVYFSYHAPQTLPGAGNTRSERKTV